MRMYDYRYIDWNLTDDEATLKLREKYGAQVWSTSTPDKREIFTELMMLYEFGKLGINAGILEVAKKDYNSFCVKSKYKTKYTKYYPDNLWEKSLEHFIAYTLLGHRLGLNKNFLDMAAETSPHAEIFSRLTGCNSFTQDIMYPAGVAGSKIGSSCSAIPLPDGFVNAALLACSFEHFEQDEDTKTARELARILAPDGMIVIAPLYIYDFEYYRTSPRFAVSGDVKFEGESIIFTDTEFNNRHERVYSPQTLLDRVIIPTQDKIDWRVLYVHNYRIIHPSVYCNFVLEGVKK